MLRDVKDLLQQSDYSIDEGAAEVLQVSGFEELPWIVYIDNILQL